MRITTTHPRVFRTVEVSFTYATDLHSWDVVAQVETDGKDSYTMIQASGIDEVSDHVWRCVAEKAEELAWEQDQKPVNRAGCECPPYGEGTIKEITHDRDCPLKLQGEEREAYNDLLAKEKRESHRADKDELHRDMAYAARESSYAQEQRRQIDENTDIYINLK